MSDIIFRRYRDQLHLELALRNWGRKIPKIAEAKAWLLFSLYVGEIIIAAPIKEQNREEL